MALLRTVKLCKSFGSLLAVNNVDIEVEEGKTYSVIGPNGAGKTTLFNLISGHLEPTSGSISFRNGTINGLKPFQTSHVGIGRSFQLNNLFPRLTVFENIRLAVQSRRPCRFNFVNHIRKYKEVDSKTEAIVERIGLTPVVQKMAENLSHGDKRLLEIGIALSTEPELLLLDEPTSGMAPEETTQMIEFIKSLSKGLTIILIEHKMTVVMTISEQVIVMHQGSVIARGSPAEVQVNPEVKSAYLGGL